MIYFYYFIFTTMNSLEVPGTFFTVKAPMDGVTVDKTQDIVSVACLS
jgi:hypothetical protein